MYFSFWVLQHYFGFSTFRPYQKEVIEKIMEGKDCMVVMATGSGKSLCYHIPPLIARKTGIVISPLLSLMQDQVMALKQRGIEAEYLGTTQSDRTVQTKAESGLYSLLFMTPEKACAIPNSFWTKLLNSGICLFAVDEAHCISEWGHDFRVEYKQLDKLRPILSGVPFVSLTATATEKVRLDIIKSLKMKDPYVAVGTFDRKNLFYGVKPFNRGYPFLDELVQEVSKAVASAGSTIIYCLTIKDVEQIHQLLENAGIKTGIYHGQLGNKAREEAHRLFIRDELNVMVATVAFGMGIDKPNIRQVIHYGCPKSLETYYQESGRCGRDGIASICWLYYTRSDFAKSDFYCSGFQTEKQRKAVLDSLMEAQKYCLLTTCRRKFLLEHFGEKVPAENCGNASDDGSGRGGALGAMVLQYLYWLKWWYFCGSGGVVVIGGSGGGVVLHWGSVGRRGETKRKKEEALPLFVGGYDDSVGGGAVYGSIGNDDGIERRRARMEAVLIGNCDNCTTTRREQDMSKEAYLLMACVQSCRGNWGLNLPIDVLRGSRDEDSLKNGLIIPSTVGLSPLAADCRDHLLLPIGSRQSDTPRLQQLWRLEMREMREKDNYSMRDEREMSKISKRIVGAQFDRLPLHGLGKAYSSHWWKSLGSLLISHGYLKETVSDVYRFVSVSTKGVQYLNSAGPDRQPPLILPIIDELNEEVEGVPGQVEALKTLTSESEGLAEVGYIDDFLRSYFITPFHFSHFPRHNFQPKYLYLYNCKV
ncbi:ATP-dependent DNA helicase RecQ [Bienertia sinuspersici]